LVYRLAVVVVDHLALVVVAQMPWRTLVVAVVVRA
jgi:hypothetical protein